VVGGETGAYPAAQTAQELEGGSRNLSGFWAVLVTVVAVGMSLFHLYTAGFGVLLAMKQRGVHLAFALFLIFLLFPGSKRAKRNVLPLYDVGLATLAAGVVAYGLVFFEELVLRAGAPLPLDLVVGGIAIALLLEATRRAVGPALPIVALVFILYAFVGPYLTGPLAHRGFSWQRLIEHLYLTTEGVFGIPLGVSATFVFMFVLFGAFLERSGAGEYLMRLAFATVGGMRGGPAKAAVVGSGLLGMISGSSVANVVTTGSLTIPIMKRTGLPPETAGAVEVAASTNGQFLPPVMGAAAFVMAEMTGIPYVEICKAAFVPAVLSYIAILGIVHIEALKRNLRGLPREEIPAVVPTLLGGLHFLVPVAVLLYLLLAVRATPLKAGYHAVLTTLMLIVVLRIYRMARGCREQGAGAVWGQTRSLWTDVLASLETGARNMAGIAAACACAGIVVGVITLTGLGLRMTSLIVQLSGGKLLLTLIYTSIASLILGLGLPTTAKYIVVSVLTAPAILLVGPNVPLIAAHLFIFYYGILADDTPPVGLAAYAAAGIARSDPIKTGFLGFKFDLSAFLLPFIFVYNPGLLLVDTTWYQALALCATSIVGMYAFSAAIQGYLIRPTRWWERLLLAAVGFALVRPGLVTDIVGIGGLALVYMVQRSRNMPEVLPGLPQSR